MFTQMLNYGAMVMHRTRQLLMKVYILPPFEPACPVWYTQLAERRDVSEIPDDQHDAFHHAVNSFMTNWIVPDSGLNIMQAMSMFSNDEYECNKLYYPRNQVERAKLHYSRLFEVIVRENYIAVALFVAAANLNVDYEEHQYVVDPDLLKQRKARYLDDFTGMIYRVLPEPSTFVYNPERPIVVYKLILPADHPLRAWCPAPIEK